MSGNALKICCVAVLLIVLLVRDVQCQSGFVPGRTYFGSKGYIEYIAGNLPIIISAPHDGDMNPSSIPNRRCPDCVSVADAGTQELTRLLGRSLERIFGCSPHIVINRLHRRKLDANRSIAEAALGNPEAEQAWIEFHQFIDSAKQASVRSFGSGLYLDIHGHGHDIQRVELGYLLRDDELRLPNDSLNSPSFITWSSLRNLAGRNALRLSHSELIRSDKSFGSLLARRGYPAVPSQEDPYPLLGEEYFDGGYNTARHSSYRGGTIDGLQIESNFIGVRDSQNALQRYADTLAVVIAQFIRLHYAFNPALVCPLVTSVQGMAMENNSPAIRVLPQPASEFVSVSLPRQIAECCTVRVWDMLGTVVFEGKCTINNGSVTSEGEYQYVIETQAVPQGIYTLQVQPCKLRLPQESHLLRTVVIIHHR